MPNPLFSKNLKKISIEDNSSYALSIKGILDDKGKAVYNRIKNHIYGKNILDIGVGAGGVAYQLKKQNYNVTGIDVVDLSMITETAPLIYDGISIPFDDKKFDTALIVHVLHHCKNGFEVLREAKRVAKRVILIEDTYRNNFERLIVSFDDMLGNFEFFAHPYYKSSWWKDFIKNEGWNLIHSEEYSEFTYRVLYGRYVLLVIE